MSTILNKFYVINLERDKDRLSNFYQNKNAHLFTRFEAVDGSLEKNKNYFDSYIAEKFYARIIGQNELACSASHFELYNSILFDESISEDEFIIIAEDDILLCDNWLDELNIVINNFHKSNINIIQLSNYYYYNTDMKEDSLNDIKRSSEFPLQDTRLKYFVTEEHLHIGAFFYAIRKRSIRKAQALFNGNSSINPFINKRLFKKISSKNKFFWFADDFSVFEERQNILYLNPVLCYHNFKISSNLEPEREKFLYDSKKIFVKYNKLEIFYFKFLKNRYLKKRKEHSKLNVEKVNQQFS